MTALPQDDWTEESYLAFERESDIKHEYRAGEVYAMSGASREHNIIASTVTGILFNHLLDKPCEHYQGDMRVHVPDTPLYTYPDVVVVCGEVKLLDDVFDTLLNPTVIVEVLSPSTEKYDRGEKFQDYRKLESLREYVLVSQTQPRIEHYLRQDDGSWKFTEAIGLESSIALPSIDCELDLNLVYRKVNFEKPSDTA